MHNQEATLCLTTCCYPLPRFQSFSTLSGRPSLRWLTPSKEMERSRFVQLIENALYSIPTSVYRLAPSYFLRQDTSPTLRYLRCVRASFGSLLSLFFRPFSVSVVMRRGGEEGAWISQRRNIIPDYPSTFYSFFFWRSLLMYQERWTFLGNVRMSTSVPGMALSFVYLICECEGTSEFDGIVHEVFIFGWI